MAAGPRRIVQEKGLALTDYARTVAAFRMYLRLISHTIQPDEMTARLQVDPDEVAAMGSRRRPASPPRQHATWKLHAKSESTSARTEDLELAALKWGPALAESIRKLVDSGDVDASLVIVQEIRDIDDGQQKGIALGVELLAWMATARAGLDIDQYIYHDCGDDSSEV